MTGCVLTLAYVTSRKDPKFEWWFDAITRQAKGNWEDIRIVVVSSALWGKDYKEPFSANLNQQPVMSVITPPIESVWQGPSRLTNEDFFAASNARNTALCLAPDGWIAYCDDLSVPCAGWLDFIRGAMTQSKRIYLGAYRKVKNLVVKDGVAESYTVFPGGNDNRWNHGMDNEPVPCNGDMLYGCSLLAPVEQLLAVNGWPSAICDGMGFEDVLMGIALENAGFRFSYVRQMLTLESEELHHVEPAYRRDDQGVSPDDKSHRALNIVKSGCKWFDNCYNVAQAREAALLGYGLPKVGNPQHEWYTGKHLSEL